MCSVDPNVFVIWVEVGICSGRASIPSDGDCMSGCGSVVINLELITMWVTVELSADDHVESINDATIFTWPEHETRATSWWNMSENVDSFTGLFSSQQRIVEPLKGICNFSSAVHEPKVVDVAVVVVQRYDSETGGSQGGVVATMSDSGQCSTGKPSVTRPSVGREIIKPLSWQRRLGDMWWRESESKIKFVILRIKLITRGLHVRWLGCKTKKNRKRIKTQKSTDHTLDRFTFMISKGVVDWGVWENFFEEVVDAVHDLHVAIGRFLPKTVVGHIASVVN